VRGLRDRLFRPWEKALTNHYALETERWFEFRREGLSDTLAGQSQAFRRAWFRFLLEVVRELHHGGSQKENQAP
jgi:hypothetical protein